MMAKYGDDVINWWNDAFQELRESGQYEVLCEQAERQHGGCRLS